MIALREVCITILNMNLVIATVILVVLVIRQIIHKVPVKYRFYLWAIVAFRMLSPISFSSMFSLFHIGSTKEAKLILLQDPTVQPIIQPPRTSLPSTTNTTIASTTDVSLDILSILAVLWLTGCILLMLYGLYSYHRLKKQLSTAVRVRENIFYAEAITSPFVFGILRPRIYMPYHLTKEEEGFIIAHEKMHIQRSDHILKQVVYYLACIHWFNPLIWIGYHFFEKDMEMACDEAVLQKIGLHQRCSYSDTLLHMAMDHHRPVYAPLSFGETGVKERIHHILAYHKPKVVISVMVCIILMISGVVLLSNPKAESEETGLSRHEEVTQVRKYFDISAKDTESVDALIKLLHHPNNAEYTWQFLPPETSHGITNFAIEISYTNLSPEFINEHWSAIQQLLEENKYYLINVMKDLDSVVYKDQNGMLDPLFTRDGIHYIDDLESRIDYIDRGLPDLSDYKDSCIHDPMCQPYEIDEEKLKKDGFHILKDRVLSKDAFASFLEDVENNTDSQLYYVFYTEEGYPILNKLTYLYREYPLFESFGNDYFDIHSDESRDKTKDRFPSFGSGGKPSMKMKTQEDGSQKVYLVSDASLSIDEINEENSVYVFDVK